MATYTITIPNWRPALLNELMKAHWDTRNKRKKASKNIVRCYTQHLPKAEKKRLVRLCLVLGKGQRKCDVDAPYKDLLDALVAAGMLVDDSPLWCEIAPITFMRGDMATIIQLEDME